MEADWLEVASAQCVNFDVIACVPLVVLKELDHIKGRTHQVGDLLIHLDCTGKEANILSTFFVRPMSGGFAALQRWHKFIAGTVYDV